MTHGFWLALSPLAGLALFGLFMFAVWLRMRWHMALGRRAEEADAAYRERLKAWRAKGFRAGVEPIWYPPTPPARPISSEDRQIQGLRFGVQPAQPMCGVERYGRVPCRRCGRPLDPGDPS